MTLNERLFVLSVFIQLYELLLMVCSMIRIIGLHLILHLSRISPIIETKRSNLLKFETELYYMLSELLQATSLKNTT